jgi:hypothetical protein
MQLFSSAAGMRGNRRLPYICMGQMAGHQYVASFVGNDVPVARDNLIHPENYSYENYDNKKK